MIRRCATLSASISGAVWWSVNERRWHHTSNAYHGAGPKAKRSPKARSAVPGTVSKVSQVACNVLGSDTPPERPMRRLGSSQQDRGGIGANLWQCRGLVVLCLLLRLSPSSKNKERRYEQRDREGHSDRKPEIVDIGRANRDMTSKAQKRRNRSRMKQAQSRANVAKAVSLGPRAPWNGDHGTGTQAANENTEVVPVTDADGRNPNRMGRRQRKDTLRALLDAGRLSMRQWQAGNAIARAYCASETLSSGSPLKERVQASPKPDATIDVQVAAMSRLVHVMSAVAQSDRSLIEAVCWHNLPLRSLSIRRSGNRLRDALDRVADHLCY